MRCDALRMRVSMSPIGSFTDIVILVTPSSAPRLPGLSRRFADFGLHRLPGRLDQPGDLAASARLRKQMRHILNLRRKARGRPHSGQRLYLRAP